MRIAFAGNPNSGKTTMFNALTGRNERVGNWAGVTVDMKEAPIKKAYAGELELIAVDLPGAYSMSPFTAEESVTSDYIRSAHLDVIVNIVDATNLSRSLFFTTQLMELGVPVVVALNKTDINEKKRTEIDEKRLSEKLGVPVLETVSISGEGLSDLVGAALAQIGTEQKAPFDPGAVDMSDKKAVRMADRARFAYVNKLVRQVETRAVLTRSRSVDDKIDRFLTDKWLGIPIFAAVMFFVFQISQSWVGPAIAEGFAVGSVEIPGLVTLIDSIAEWVRSLLVAADAAPILEALLVDGMIGGVGAVVGFLPLVMVMYFLIALLEDCGYMARVAVVLDPIFKKVGLSGRSVIPFVIGIGCAVPGVMACRTIRNERERRAAAMLTPFMPCGAKIPIIALFAGAFFDNAGWVSFAMYVAGIAVIFFGALLVNKITSHTAKRSFFIIELPEYKVPSLWGAFKTMCGQGWAYVVKAATIILLCNTAVQIMQSFNWQLRLVAEGAENTSILASVAGPFAYLLVPMIGVVSWQMAAAAITGFIAKENVVGTLAVCFGATQFINAEELALVEGEAANAAALMTGINGAGEVASITAVAALAYLMFNLFSPPCFAAIGAMHAEMKNTKWLLGGIVLQLSIGYTVGFFVYQVGTLLLTGALGAAFLPGLAAVWVIGGVVAILCIRPGKK